MDNTLRRAGRVRPEAGKAPERKHIPTVPFLSSATPGLSQPTISPPSSEVLPRRRDRLGFPQH